jgi:ferritin-like protein
MAQATKQLIAGVDIEAVVKGLDRVRSSHLASMHWAHIVRDSLEGPALFLLAAELEEVASESRQSANALGERIAELDGQATGDPTRALPGLSEAVG